MTKKDLVRVIRKLVKEEVQKEVGKILISERKIPQKKSKPAKKKTYTKDKTLNEVLNETVGLTKSHREEYPDMGGKQYTTGNMADLLGYGDLASPELKRDKVAAQTLAEKGVTPEQVGDGVVKALTRDYSDLMKVINKDK
jgi:hypothetical protein|tara:strand:- start:82 stop:501 length:420 start_codon:yes stop_codon:yes gene_type:complete